MARNKRKRNRDERDTPAIANDPVARPSAPPDDYARRYAPRFTDIEDRRHFHPERFEPFKSKTGATAQLRTRDPRKAVVRNIAKRLWDRSIIGRAQRSSPLDRALRIFNEPGRVLVCVRRQRRKEVLHSLKKTGAGGRRNRKPKRTERSYYQC